MVSEEERQEYARLRNEFHKRRDEMQKRIREHTTKRDLEQMSIVKLKREIENSQPDFGKKGRIVSGVHACPECDVYSMECKRLGDARGSRKSTMTFDYECLICGYKANC